MDRYAHIMGKISFFAEVCGNSDRGGSPSGARKYELGVATVVDYNTALDNLVNANSQLLQAKYEYIFKTRIIHFYITGTVK